MNEEMCNTINAINNAPLVRTVEYWKYQRFSLISLANELLTKYEGPERAEEVIQELVPLCGMAFRVRYTKRMKLYIELTN